MRLGNWWLRLENLNRASRLQNSRKHFKQLKCPLLLDDLINSLMPYRWHLSVCVCVCVYKYIAPTPHTIYLLFHFFSLQGRRKTFFYIPLEEKLQEMMYTQYSSSKSLQLWYNVAKTSYTIKRYIMNWAPIKFVLKHPSPLTIRISWVNKLTCFGSV